MHLLRPLRLHESWIYEVLISTFRDRTPHAAPIGVWAEGADELFMDVYAGSQTLTNIVQAGSFAANFPADVGSLYAALRAPDSLEFTEARLVCAPLVAECTTTAELTLSSATPRGDTVRIAGRVARVDQAGAPRLINRAEGLLLESLVLATRLGHVESADVLATLKENHRIVRRVAPGSEYEHALEALLRDLRSAS
jgi:hypothetical protein